MEPEEAIPPPHPYLHDAVLYISGAPTDIPHEVLGTPIKALGLVPYKFQFDQDPSSGLIQFKDIEVAEKALVVLQGRPILPEPDSPVYHLSPFPPTNPPTPLPPPNAQPRLVKQLPPDFTDSQLYDLFRPFGPLANVRMRVAGPDTGLVVFWREEDGREAQSQLHFADVEGNNIAVQVYQPPRGHRGPGGPPGISEFSVNAPAFVPGASLYPYPPQYSPPAAPPPPRQTYSPRGLAPVPVPFLHGPGQQVQLSHGSHSGLIDPCNLFIKNLDSEIDSNALFSAFRRFGQIVSARVMRNENGESRGFGFVSFQTPDQSSNAMTTMNGVHLGSKPIVVRLHEPKQLRQEKLAARFGGANGHPRSASGATSPTLSVSEAGESHYGGGWASPRPVTIALHGSTSPHHEPARLRRGSGSYYNAALSGTLNLPMKYDDLAALSPVVRKEVLTGELSRRIKSMQNVAPDEMDAVVESIVNMSLGEVVNAIHDPTKLSEQVRSAQNIVRAKKTASQPLEPPKSPSPSASQDSRLLDSATLNATASAPEHPSTPVSVSASIATPPRTSSPSGSVAPPGSGSERERMLAAVHKLESSRQAELTELLMSLPKRERAMCLFNAEVLRVKIADAKLVLESMDDDDDEGQTAAVPVTPQARKISTMYEDSPKTPELSSRGPSVAGSPTPVTPGGPASNLSSGGHTISSLARLPASEIVKLANSPSSTGLPLPKTDMLVVKATNEFVDSLLDKPIQQQKQALGDKLFKVIKSFGVKGAPKLTIALLDQEDLRALAHLMNSYPAVLKEKVLIVQGAASSGK